MNPKNKADFYRMTNVDVDSDSDSTIIPTSPSFHTENSQDQQLKLAQTLNNFNANLPLKINQINNSNEDLQSKIARSNKKFDKKLRKFNSEQCKINANSKHINSAVKDSKSLNIKQKLCKTQLTINSFPNKKENKNYEVDYGTEKMINAKLNDNFGKDKNKKFSNDDKHNDKTVQPLIPISNIYETSNKSADVIRENSNTQHSLELGSTISREKNHNEEPQLETDEMANFGSYFSMDVERFIDDTSDYIETNKNDPKIKMKKSKVKSTKKSKISSKGISNCIKHPEEGIYTLEYQSIIADGDTNIKQLNHANSLNDQTSRVHNDKCQQNISKDSTYPEKYITKFCGHELVYEDTNFDSYDDKDSGSEVSEDTNLDSYDDKNSGSEVSEDTNLDSYDDKNTGSEVSEDKCCNENNMSDELSSQHAGEGIVSLASSAEDDIIDRWDNYQDELYPSDSEMSEEKLDPSIVINDWDTASGDDFNLQSTSDTDEDEILHFFDQSKRALKIAYKSLIRIHPKDHFKGLKEIEATYLTNMHCLKTIRTATEQHIDFNFNSGPDILYHLNDLIDKWSNLHTKIIAIKMEKYNSVKDLHFDSGQEDNIDNAIPKNKISKKKQPQPESEYNSDSLKSEESNSEGNILKPLISNGISGNTVAHTAKENSNIVRNNILTVNNIELINKNLEQSQTKNVVNNYNFINNTNKLNNVMSINDFESYESDLENKVNKNELCRNLKNNSSQNDFTNKIIELNDQDLMQSDSYKLKNGCVSNVTELHTNSQNNFNKNIFKIEENKINISNDSLAQNLEINSNITIINSSDSIIEEKIVSGQNIVHKKMIQKNNPQNNKCKFSKIKNKDPINREIEDVLENIIPDIKVESSKDNTLTFEKTVKKANNANNLSNLCSNFDKQNMKSQHKYDQNDTDMISKKFQTVIYRKKKNKVNKTDFKIDDISNSIFSNLEIEENVLNSDISTESIIIPVNNAQNYHKISSKVNKTINKNKSSPNLAVQVAKSTVYWSIEKFILLFLFAITIFLLFLKFAFPCFMNKLTIELTKEQLRGQSPI